MDSLGGGFRKGDESFCLNISHKGLISSFFKKELNDLKSLCILTFINLVKHRSPSGGQEILACFVTKYVSCLL